MANARIDQSVRESIQTGNPKARVDQAVREAILSYNPNARIMQCVREAIIPAGALVTTNMMICFTAT